MAEASRQQVLDSVKNFLTSGKYSDLVITCGTDSYNVHKVVVCNRADFFARAVKFGGKESSEGKVDLPDDDPAVVKLLVDYLYEGEYEPRLPDITTSVLVATIESSKPPLVKLKVKGQRQSITYKYQFPHTCTSFEDYCRDPFVCPHHTCDQNCVSSCVRFICDKCTRLALPKLSGSASQTLTHAKMYEIADKYDVVGLKDLAREKYKLSCSTFWDKDDFSIAAHYAFSTTMADDKGLRDIVSRTISEHMELMQKDEIKTLLAEFNGLALGILLKKADEHGWV